MKLVSTSFIITDYKSDAISLAKPTKSETPMVAGYEENSTLINKQKWNRFNLHREWFSNLSKS